MKPKAKKTDAAPFGKVLAGVQRKLPKGKPEPNTPDEIDFITWLNAYIETPVVKLPLYFSTTIEKLLKTGQYNDIIVTPNMHEVFRGMHLEKDKFVEFIKQLGPNATKSIYNPDLAQLKTGEIKNFSTPIYFKPKPDRNFSSWTKSPNTAKRFSLDTMTSGGIRSASKKTFEIILTARVTGNNDKKFLDLRNWYEEINSNNEIEQEVIAIGNIEISSIRWFRVG